MICNEFIEFCVIIVLKSVVKIDAPFVSKSVSQSINTIAPIADGTNKRRPQMRNLFTFQGLSVGTQNQSGPKRSVSLWTKARCFDWEKRERKIA
jgi:hypothetical protein